MDTVAALVEYPTSSLEFNYYLKIASGAQLEDAIAKVNAKGAQKTRLKLLTAKRQAMR